MLKNVMFSLSALMALVPAFVVPLARGAAPHNPGRDGVFWAVLALAVAGPAIWAMVLIGDTWRTGLSATLWVTIAVCMVLFAGLCATTRTAWRLTPLLIPYLLLVGLLATLTMDGSGSILRGTAPIFWIDLHIAMSVTTYALLTLAAVAALAAFLQERALKAKRPTTLTRLLPSMADSETIQARLLAASEIVLGLGLLTGMAVLYFEQGVALRFDHKTLLSIAAFFVIGGLLIAHALTGVRGRRGARFVLVAFLLLTLAYPGVKFVTGILIS